MKCFESLRRVAYWNHDRLSGGNVAGYLREIHSHFNNGTPDTLAEYREQKLRPLMGHAVKTTAFYAPYHAATSLSDFPIIDKNRILDNFDAFRSEALLNAPVFLVATSGSTGVHFRLYQDRGKKFRNTADTLYFAQTTGYDVGHKFYYLRAWDTVVHGKKSAVLSFIQNVKKVNVNTLDETTVEKLIAELKRDQRSSINFIGYPSAFEVILAFLDENQPGLRLNNVISIIGIGEPLDSHSQARMMKYFKCPVVSRYSNNEMGILAQQPTGGVLLPRQYGQLSHGTP